MYPAGEEGLEHVNPCRVPVMEDLPGVLLAKGAW